MNTFKNRWIQLFGLLGVLTTLTWATDRFLIQPQVTEAENLSLAIQKRGKDIEKILSDFPDLQKLQANLQKELPPLQSLRKKVSSVDKKVLTNREARSLLRGDALQEREGLFWKKIAQVGKTEKFLPYVRQTIQIKTTASYHAIADYLNSLERSSPFLDIRSIRLWQEEGGETGRLQAEISVRITHSL